MGTDDPYRPDGGNTKDPAAELAARIADGSMIDWPAGGTDSATRLDPATVEQLKAIAAIADLRRVAADDGVGPATARTWGSLTIVGRIGAGQFGEVFRAWDTTLQREVALKILRTPDSLDPLAPSRAIEEARHLARVRHRNVLTVYGAEQIGNRTGIWTELIEGETLELIITKHGPLAEDDVVAIALDLCRALAAVHCAGIAHRDVKAQNVMREVGGRVVLMDFGTGISLSRATGRPRDLSGTPLYLAPEILAGAAPNTSTDLYALSVLLFHLLTCDYPVPGATLEEVRANHESGNRRKLKDMAPRASQALAAVIDRGLSVEPDQRHRTANDLERELLAAAPTPQTDSRAEGTRRVGRSWLAAMGVALTLVAVAWPFFNSGTQNQWSELVCEVCVGPDVEIRGATLSPDGRWLAVADAVTGDLLVRDLRTGKVRSLELRARLAAAMPFLAPSSETLVLPSYPVFFADSKRLAFRWVGASVADSESVWTVDILGAHPPELWLSSARGLRAIYDLAPDGKSILVSMDRPERPGGQGPVRELAWISLDGTVRTVTSPWGRATSTGTNSWTMEVPSSARVSPDGRNIAYEWEPATSAVPGRRVRHIYLLSSEGREPREAVITAADNSNPSWSADGHRLFFTSDVSGTFDLWSVSVQNDTAVGAPTLVRSDVGNVTLLTISPTGMAHYLRGMPRREYIFITDTAKAMLPPGEPPIERVIAGGRPNWSDDGKVLRFLRRQSPSNARPSSTPLRFTMADGREDVDRTETSEKGLWPYPLVGGLSRERLLAFFDAVVAAPPSAVYGPAAPKTGYLAEDEGMDIEFASRLVNPLLYAFRSDSTSEVRVGAVVAIDVTSGKVNPVCVLPNRRPGRSERGAIGISLSPDSQGLALALWSEGRATLGVLEISTCEYRQIYGPYPTQSTANKVGWSPDGQAILVSEEVGEGNRIGYQILKIPVSGGQAERLIRLNGTDRETSFAISIDGLLAFSPHPAFEQSFSPAAGTSFQVWRLHVIRK